MESTEDVQMEPQTEGKLVIKRDGSKQPFDSNKILHRIKNLAYGLNSEYVTLQEVVDKVATGLSDGKFSVLNLFRNNNKANRRFRSRNMCIYDNCTPRLLYPCG